MTVEEAGKYIALLEWRVSHLKVVLNDAREVLVDSGHSEGCIIVMEIDTQLRVPDQ